MFCSQTHDFFFRICHQSCCCCCCCCYRAPGFVTSLIDCYAIRRNHNHIYNTSPQPHSLKCQAKHTNVHKSTLLSRALPCKASHQYQHVSAVHSRQFSYSSMIKAYNCSGANHYKLNLTPSITSGMIQASLTCTDTGDRGAAAWPPDNSVLSTSLCFSSHKYTCLVATVMANLSPGMPSKPAGGVLLSTTGWSASFLVLSACSWKSLVRAKRNAVDSEPESSAPTQHAQPFKLQITFSVNQVASMHQCTRDTNRS